MTGHAIVNSGNARATSIFVASMKHVGSKRRAIMSDQEEFIFVIMISYQA
jgi:hypothetical protein